MLFCARNSVREDVRRAKQLIFTRTTLKYRDFRGAKCFCGVEPSGPTKKPYFRLTVEDLSFYFRSTSPSGSFPGNRDSAAAAVRW